MELRFFTLSILSLTLALFGEFYHHAYITEEEIEVWSSCVSNVNTISEQQSFNLNPSLADPRVRVHCRFTAYDHGYSYTRKVDQGQTKGPEGSGRCVEVQDLGWTTRGKEEQIESITSLYLLMDTKEKIKLELKRLHQIILATQCIVPKSAA